MLSVPREDSAEAVKKVLSDYEETKSAYKSSRIAYFEREAELVPITSENLILSFIDAEFDCLRAMANKAVDKVSGMLVLLSGKDGEYKYLIASKSVDLKSEVKNMNAALCGKGGGSAVMVQGTFLSSITDIEKYFT